LATASVFLFVKTGAAAEMMEPKCGSTAFSAGINHAAIDEPLTFDMSGRHRLARGCPLDGGVRPHHEETPMAR